MLLDISISKPVSMEIFLIGSFLTIFGLISRLVKKKLYLNEPIIGTIFGILMGPECLDIISFLPRVSSQPSQNDRFGKTTDHGWSEDELSINVLGWICRLTIGIQVFFAGSGLPNRYLGDLKNLISITVLMLPIMLLGLAVSSLIIKLSFPSLTVLESLILGGALTPTDPVLANSVVKGSFAERFVSEPIRNLLVVESALNDGFGTPFVYLPLSIIIGRSPDSSSWKDLFFLRIILWNVIFGSVMGFLIGFVLGIALKFSRFKKDSIDHQSFFIFPVSISLLVIGLMNVLDSNELLACFFAGCGLSWVKENRSEDFNNPVTESIETLLDSIIFIILGSLMPIDRWRDGSFESIDPSRLVLCGFMIMIFRRIPAILCFYRTIPMISNFKEALFFGHFGPIGVGAIYYAVLATQDLTKIDERNRSAIIPIIFFVALISIIVHGLSTPLIVLIRSIISFRSDRFVREEIEDFTRRGEENQIPSNNSNSNSNTNTNNINDDDGGGGIGGYKNGSLMRKGL